MVKSTATRPPVECTRRHLRHGGRTRSFLLVRGQIHTPNPALVLMLHGTLQTAANIRPFAGYSFDAYAATGAAIVAYPDAVRREWNGARATVMLSKGSASVDDVGFLRAVVDYAVTTEHVDPARVFVVGFSLGGQMTIRLIHEIPELLAGAAVLGANMPASDNLTIDRDANMGLPVLTLHGTADPLAPYEGGQVGFHGRFPKGMHLSATDTAGYFAARNGIHSAPTLTELQHRPDPGKPTSVTRRDYAAPGAAPVRFFTVHGGGHVIPNPEHAPAPWFWGPSTGDISAADVIGDFFSLTPHEGTS